jgi:hypothetical protein
VPVVIRGYYDMSKCERPEKIRSVTLAGYAGTLEKWEEFEVEWARVLAGDGNRPSTTSLHMKDANTFNGEFSRSDGWTPEHVKALFTDAANCLSALENRGDDDRCLFSGVSCTVRLDDYERAVKTLPNLKRKEPEAICVDRVTGRAIRMLAPPEGAHVDDLKSVGHVELWFDQNEPFINKIDRVWRQRPAPDRPKVLELVRAVKNRDATTKTTPFQAADFLAWNTNRYVTEGDVHAFARRFLTPMFDYTYEKLVEEYKDWKGYVRTGKYRPPTAAV